MLTVVVLTALVTYATMVVAGLLLDRAPNLPVPFLLSYAVGIVLQQPWTSAAGALHVAGDLVLLLLWVLLGCALGTPPALVTVSLAIGRGWQRRR